MMITVRDHIFLCPFSNLTCDLGDFGFGTTGAVNMATWAKPLQGAVNAIVSRAHST
jgi:hypothetical protein